MPAKRVESPRLKRCVRGIEPRRPRTGVQLQSMHERQLLLRHVMQYTSWDWNSPRTSRSHATLSRRIRVVEMTAIHCDSLHRCKHSCRLLVVIVSCVAALPTHLPQNHQATLSTPSSVTFVVSLIDMSTESFSRFFFLFTSSLHRALNCTVRCFDDDELIVAVVVLESSRILHRASLWLAKHCLCFTERCIQCGTIRLVTQRLRMQQEADHHCHRATLEHDE